MIPSRPQTENPFPLLISFSPSGSCPTPAPQPVRCQRRPSHFSASPVGRAITATHSRSLSFKSSKCQACRPLLCGERTVVISRAPIMSQIAILVVFEGMLNQV